MKSENKEVKRVRTEMSDPFHRLVLIFIPDISQNNNLALVTQSNNGWGELEQRGTTGEAARRQGHEGRKSISAAEERCNILFLAQRAGGEI